MNIKRRVVLTTFAALATPMPSLVFGQDRLLPLRTPGVDHLDVIVPDVAATARFYMGLFNTTLHAQALGTGLRYFVLLGTLGPGREVGYIAIGDSRGRPTKIGHFCTTIKDYQRDRQAIFEAMGREFAAAGFGEFPGSTGFAGVFTDPDGIEIQYLPAPDTLVTAANPADLVPWNQGLVTPFGLDHVLLRVSNLGRAVDWYAILYGTPHFSANRSYAWFEFPESNTRIYLQGRDYVYGPPTEIAHYGVKVAAFDEAAVTRRVQELGGTVEPQPFAGALRIRDPDGNILELTVV